MIVSEMKHFVIMHSNLGKHSLKLC